jgi:hypothetical protein
LGLISSWYYFLSFYKIKLGSMAMAFFSMDILILAD